MIGFIDATTFDLYDSLNVSMKYAFCHKWVLMEL